uniref:Uncharacterized protein n=1 Tax=Arundo donax TaxID=35708 RepID=A0A0A8Z4B8_ARUDO
MHARVRSYMNNMMQGRSCSYYYHRTYVLSSSHAGSVCSR